MCSTGNIYVCKKNKKHSWNNSFKNKLYIVPSTFQYRPLERNVALLLQYSLIVPNESTSSFYAHQYSTSASTVEAVKFDTYNIICKCSYYPIPLHSRISLTVVPGTYLTHIMLAPSAWLYYLSKTITRAFPAQSRECFIGHWWQLLSLLWHVFVGSPYRKSYKKTFTCT